MADEKTSVGRVIERIRIRKFNVDADGNPPAEPNEVVEASGCSDTEGNPAPMPQEVLAAMRWSDELPPEPAVEEVKPPHDTL
jgi:hypothetical protein